MDKPFQTYYGGKEAAGVPQSLINVIPPHKAFVELFGGNFTLSRYINTPFKFVNDVDPDVFSKYPKRDDVFSFYNMDYRRFFEFLKYSNTDGFFMYCDPPYMMETRSTKQKVYKHEMTSREDHLEFLNTVLHYQDKYLFGISHYPNPTYDKLLEQNGWYKHDYKSQTRSGVRNERLYCNYNPETLTDLQDYRYLGNDKTDRQRIKRKIDRMVSGLRELPILEQKAILLKIKESSEA